MIVKDAFVNFYQKKLLGLSTLRDNFFGYLDAKDKDQGKAFIVDDDTGALFRPVTLANPGVGQISVTDRIHGVDGSGRIVAADPAEPLQAPFCVVPFEDTVAVSYYFAAKFAGIPSSLELNPRVADTVHYGNYQEVLGDGPYNPDAVTDLGGSVRLDIDTATENGAVVDHSGRTAVVWMVTPESPVLAVAVETLTVQNDGVNNYVQTAGVFGQSVTSVVAADYFVTVVGLTWKTVDLSVVPDHIYLGRVVGSGGGVPAITTSGQQVLWGTSVDLSNVLEVGPNGDLKIAVKAHAADVGVPQVSAIDSGGTRQWWVTENGDHHWNAGGVLSDDIAEVILAGAPGGGFGRWGNANSRVHLYDSQLIAAGYANGIALSNDPGFLNLLTPRSSYLGAIAEQQTIETILGHSGLDMRVTLSGVGTGTLNYTAAAGSSRGEVFADGPGTLSLAWGTATWFIYYDKAMGQVNAVTNATMIAYDLGDILLGWMSTAAGNITAIYDAAPVIRHIERKIPFTVGEDEGADFYNLHDAFEFVKTLRKTTGAAPTRNIELVLVGEVNETVQIVLDADHDGVILRSADRGFQNASVLWDFDGSLFVLNGASDMTFEGLNFVPDLPAGPVPTNPYSVFQITSSVASRVRILDCNLLQGANHNALHFLYGGDVVDLWMSGIRAVAQDGFMYLQATGTRERVMLHDCKWTQGGPGVGTVSQDGINLDNYDHVTFRSVTLDGALRSGIKTNAVEDLVIDRCRIDNATLLDLEISGDDVKIGRVNIDNAVGSTFTGTVLLVYGSRVQHVGTTHGFYVDSSFAEIADNYMDGGAAGTGAIWLTASAADTLVRGNRIKGWSGAGADGIHSLAVRVQIIGNNIGVADGIGIDAQGQNTTIIGNRLWGSPRGIDASAIYCGIIGNEIYSTDRCVNVSAGFARVNGNLLLGLNGTTAYGLFNSGDYQIVKGNTVRDCKTGLYVNSDANVVNGNVVYGFGSAGNENGIHMTGSYNSVCGNVIQTRSGGAGVGLYFLAGQDRNTCHSNVSPAVIGGITACTGANSRPAAANVPNQNVTL